MIEQAKPSFRNLFVLEVDAQGPSPRHLGGGRTRVAHYQATAGFIEKIPGLFAGRGLSVRGGFEVGAARAFALSDGSSSVYLAYVLEDGGRAALVLRAPGTLKWWTRARRNAFQQQVHHDLLAAGVQPAAATRSLVECERLVPAWNS